MVPTTISPMTYMTTRRVAVRAVIVKDGKLLCVRLNRSNGDGAHDYWCTPGGGVDALEALVPALERELVEETGVKPVVGQLMYVHQFAHGDKEHLEFFFHVTNAEDYENIDLSQTSHGAAEIADIGFVDPSTTNILPKFLTQTDLAHDVTTGTARIFDNFDE